MTAALAAGGREQFGWGQDRHALYDIFDALNVNTRVSWQGKKRPPKIDPAPRPGRDKTGKTKPKAREASKPTDNKPRTVKSLYAMFS